MATMTQDEIAAKIATAETSFASAVSQYDRNLAALIRDEYQAYGLQRAKEIAAAAAVAALAAS
jgi:hypothetical protein